jgi:hypothetical protein
VADYDFPADLLEAQRAFWAADTRVEEIGALFPPPTAIADGTAAAPEELRQALHEARADRGRHLDVLYGHSWWGGVDDQNKAREALKATARD